MFVMLAILVAQPLVITTGLFTPEVGTELSKTTPNKPAQDVGTRLTPEEHTNRVPILIEGEEDFVSQSWPGDGSPGSPYLIEGLNITYDINQILIRIYNTTSHFVIRDCYLGQSSTGRYAVEVINAANALIEHVTVVSKGYGIRLENVTDSRIAHIDSHVDAASYMELLQCENIQLDSNSFSGHGVSVTECKGIEITGNQISQAGTMGLFINHSNGTLVQSNLVNVTTGSGLRLDNSSHCDVRSNQILSASGRGIHLTLSENVTIEDNRVLNSGGSGLQFATHQWISVVGNHFNSSGSYPVYTTASENGIISGNIIVNTPSYGGIVFQNSAENFTISDNHIENTYGGFITFSGANLEILRNTIENVGNHFIAPVGVLDANLINNTCKDSSLFAIYLSNSHRATVSGNVVNSSYNQGVLAGGINLTISGNLLYENSIGVTLSSGSTNARVFDNWIQETETGVRIEASDAQIESNTISYALTGVGVYGSAHRAQIVDNTIDTVSTGIFARNINQSVIGNTISNAAIGVDLNTATAPWIEANTIQASETGIQVSATTQGIFENNNMTGCGFYFPPEQSLAQLNHTLIDNNVGEKPVFYDLNGVGLTLDDSYGEYILVNSTDVTITGGFFSHTTAAILAYLTDELTISSMSTVDLIYPFVFDRCENVTLQNSVMEDLYSGDGVTVMDSVRFLADNVSISRGNHNGFRLDGSSLSTIQNCEISDLDGAGVYSYSSEYGLVESNLMSNCTYGVRIEFTLYSSIRANHMQWCEYGIFSSSESDYNNATFNNIHDGLYGIRMDDSFTWYIYNNTIRWNSYGLYITQTDDDQYIYNNTFALNRIHNGFDSGSDQWDDRVDSGNYWDDYSGTGVYNIPGGTSVDSYPYRYIVTKPIINSPIDLWYAEGSVGNTIAWFPYDDALRNWLVEIDGAEWTRGAWNLDNITVNVDGLPYGTHTVTVTVWDIYQNYVNDTVLVQVYDDTPPVVDSPPDQWLFVDLAGQTIDWEVSDLNPATYMVSVDGIEFETGTWSTGTLSVNVDAIPVGRHDVVLVIYDADGNSASDSVAVLVIADDEAPTIDSPADVIYVEGATGNRIIWSPSDAHPDRYEIVLDGSVIEEGMWAGSRITFTVDGYDVGTYGFTITVYDKTGQSASDTVNLNVLAVTPMETPTEPVDYSMLAIVAGAGVVAVVVIAVLYYMTKRRGSS